jgi:hypothetical protein
MFHALAIACTIGSTPAIASAKGDVCRREFRALDDQADIDMRDVNDLIARLEAEMIDPSLQPLGNDFREGLRVKLDSAKVRRGNVLDKHHTDLNAVRARCDRVRSAG